MRGLRRFAGAAIGAAALMVAAGAVSADGTETLGPPGIAIASSSGMVAAGIGLENVQPGVINITVPAGATVDQVLLYWEGHNSTATGDDTVTANGNDVTGTLIGGPTFFFTAPDGEHYSSTYRADITALGLVGAGPNAVSIGGLDFDQVNNGAGVLVLYDDGSQAEVSIADGNDLAFVNFAPPLDTTVAQTFGFAPEPVDRVAELNMFFSSVSGPDLEGLRPSTIEITIDGVVTELVNVLGSNDGDEWDTISVDVPIPAGVGEVTVQAFSDDRDATGARPASFAWSAAGLTVPVTPPPPPPGGEGCTPGYWKQPHHLDSWVGYAPTDDYSATFGVAASFDRTLLGALGQGGGGEKALGRHAVAALLNTSSAGVDYDYTTADVIQLVQDAYASGDFNGAKNLLEAANESGCPLN